MDPLSHSTPLKALARTLAFAIVFGLPLGARGADLQGDALARADDAVVGIRVTAIDDARSAETLGRDRTGSGVVIDAGGLVLTIGYLILEADHVDVVLGGDHVVPARVVAYDQATGFGLLQPLAPLHVSPVPLGTSSSVKTADPLLVASGGPDGEVSLVKLLAQRPFSGYWEYHLDSALFTAPPRADHSGAALLNGHGELIGIGSLLVGDAAESGRPRQPGNMFVPIDLLKPILADMRRHGASASSTRAWIGLNCIEENGHVRIVRTNADGPAAQAGLQPGDSILRIDGATVGGLESFYKTLWRGGSPERDVKLDIERDGRSQTYTVHAIDRMKTLLRPTGI